MKSWFDSDVRYPSTFITHWFLLELAQWMLDDYPDGFLWIGALLLTTHLIWPFRLVRKGTPPLPIGIAASFCSVLQIGVLNRITDFDFGSAMALFFYQVMLAVFWCLMVLALLIAYCSRKKTQ